MPVCLKVERQPDLSGDITMGGETVTGQALEKYTVYFDSVTNNPLDAMGATAGGGAIPWFGSALGPYVLTCKRPTRRSNAPRIWDVECVYSLPKPGVEPKPEDPDVSRWAITFSGRSMPYDVEVDRDKDGKPLLNTVGEPLEGITRPRSDEEIDITFTCETIDFLGFDSCKDRVNSLAFSLSINGQTRTFDARTIWFRTYSWQVTLDASGALYPQCTVNLVYRKQTWDKQVANKGRKYKNAGGNVVPITNDYGDSEVAPQYLNADGTKTAVGSAAYPLTFKIFDEADIGAQVTYELTT